MRWDMRKRKRLLYGLLALVIALLLVTLATAMGRIFMILTLVALVGYVVAWSVLWRCPYCGMPLGQMDSATYCKHCGKKLYRGD